MKTDVNQKALVYNTAGEVLLVRRSAMDVRRPLQWDLPGGLLEPDEQFIDGIQREIFEETGLKVTRIKLLYSYTEPRFWKTDEGNQERNAVFLFYGASSNDTNVAISHEHNMYKWVKLHDASQYFEYDLHKQFLSYVIENNLAL